MPKNKIKTNVATALNVKTSVMAVTYICFIIIGLSFFVIQAALNIYGIIGEPISNGQLIGDIPPPSGTSGSCANGIQGPTNSNPPLYQIGSPVEVTLNTGDKVTATCYGIDHDRAPSDSKINVVFAPSNFSSDGMVGFTRFANLYRLDMVYPGFLYASVQSTKYKDDPTQDPVYQCYYQSYLSQYPNSISVYDAPGLMDFYLVKVSNSPKICEELMDIGFTPCSVPSAKALSAACFSGNRETLVLHNFDSWGGAGLYFPCNQHVASVSIGRLGIGHGSPAQVLTHEAAHIIFGFGDEYTDATRNYYSWDTNTPNCDTKGCNKWKDLIDAKVSNTAACHGSNCIPKQCYSSGNNIKKFPDAQCFENRCTGGLYYAGASDDKMTDQMWNNFGSVNERIACCKYLEVTGQIPQQCKNKFGDTYVNSAVCKNVLANANPDCEENPTPLTNNSLRMN